MAGDIELGQRHCPSTAVEPAGYPRWASWIASDPDNEPFLFRKFDELGALNLLYLQSDMLHLVYSAPYKQNNSNSSRQFSTHNTK